MDVSVLNGTQQNLLNGIPVKAAVEKNGGHVRNQNGMEREERDEDPVNNHGITNGIKQEEQENGASDFSENRLDGLPIEIKQLTQHFRPFRVLTHRSVQQTWNSFSDLIDQLTESNVMPGLTVPNASYAKPQINGASSGNQSRENLEKKDRLLNFQQDQRALYIKLLVIHDWFRKSRGIDQVIEISMWIHEQRIQFAQAADFIGNMKRELALWQVPNPDLKTAVEVLSKGRVSTLSDLGYVPSKPLSPREMLRTLQDINILLCTRLSLQDKLPPPLSKYSIHDGRITFLVPHEFELDLSVADEDPSSQFYFIDFRLLSSQPGSFLTGRLYDDFTTNINEVLRSGGLLECYDFLHDLTLSHKVNSLRRQALDIARQQWSENIRIDLINRTLVVQYWLNRPLSKSWIEIGVMSGRRKKRRDLRRSVQPFLNLRWLPEKTENHEFQVDFDVSSLSLEKILRGAVARHSSMILNGFYEKLLDFELYAGGRYLLELSSSEEDPCDCSLQVQLTNNKHVALSIEPVAGSLILSPASSLLGRTEFELNRLRNPAEDGIQCLSMLRCLAAEQETVQQAGLAGWEVIPTFQLSQGELRTRFPPKVLRYVLIRQASWQNNAMIATTFSMEGDSWWLLYPDGSDPANGPASLVSELINRSQWEEDSGRDPLVFFSHLKEYASGAIALKITEQELRQRRLRCHLPELPDLQRILRLPLLTMYYNLADARRVLTPLSSDLQSESTQVEGNTTDDNDISLSWIQSTVCLRFCGLDKISDDALLLAKGKSTASTKVFEGLGSLAGPGFKVNVEAGEFLMSFQVPIGNSILSQLLTSLLNFDSLLSCLTIVKSFNSMSIQSLSLSQITVQYNREAELSTSIRFPSSSSSAAIKLLPEDSNHQARISHFVEILLANLKQPFTANLGGVLTILTTTHPLLSLFDDLEKLQLLPDAASENSPSSHLSTVSLHVIARSPTHYALQYFASSPSAHDMIARVEIFRHLRRDTPVWILRPALEETVSYSRSSFAETSLKQRLVDEIFTVQGAQGWLGLDTGASCPLDSPGPLVRRVDEVVRTWAQTTSFTVVGAVQKQGEHPKDGIEEQIVELKADPGPSTLSTQHHPHPHPHQPPQQRTGNVGSRPAVNGITPKRNAPNTPRPAQSGQPRPKDVITLD